MKSITVQELSQMIENQEQFILIDVREPFENDICTLNGIQIPMAEVPQRHEEFIHDGKVIVHCRSGIRSANSITFLENEYGLDNLYNLSGGILSWAKEINPEMDTY